MIKAMIRADIRKTVKALERIHTKEIPAAREAALREGAAAGISKGYSYLSKKIGVPRKYLAGTTVELTDAAGVTFKAKGVGGRLTRRKPDLKRGNISIDFKYNHINPAGTKKFPAELNSVWGFTESGKKRKGFGELKSNITRKSYPRAWTYKKAAGWKVPMILQRTGGSAYPIRWVKQEIEGEAQRGTTAEIMDKGGKAFVDRYEHHLKRRLNKNGS